MNEKSGSGDNIASGTTITDSSGVFIGKDMNIQGSINISSVNNKFTNIHNEYANGLKEFSEIINDQLEEHNIPKEKSKAIFSSIDALAEEIKDIKAGPEQRQIDLEKEKRIDSKLTGVLQKVLDVLPQAADTASTFTPLAPFHTLIGKGVQQIVDAINNRKNKA